MDDTPSMVYLTTLVLKAQIWRDRQGQDLIEYALLAGFVAVAVGVVMPEAANNIHIIFSKVNSLLVLSAAS